MFYNISWFYFANFLQNRGNIMLLEFRTKNYKSFADEISFSVIAAPKQTGLDYSLCIQKTL